ncbi:hypothetical protein PENTCL1PPCAC_2776, partial [Pristionchus entomophagus]
SILQSFLSRIMSNFVPLVFLLLSIAALSSARPEPEIVAWNELEEGIAGIVRVPRGVDNFRKPFCMCITAENCPCRNSGNQRGA